MNVKLLVHTPEPEKIITIAAETCYSNQNTEELWETHNGNIQFIEKLKHMGHMSPFEHVSFTFGIDGVSRALLAQLTRHRIASFSVQSQRYVVYNNSCVVPEPIKTLGLKVPFIEDMEVSYDTYYFWFEKLKQMGLSEKEASENARYFLPNAAETNLVMTMNARELMHFFELRCCNRAQDEIRELAWTILGIVSDICPEVFANEGPNCVKDKCKEGKLSCGNPYRKK